MKNAACAEVINSSNGVCTCDDLLQYLYMIHVVPPVLKSTGQLKQVVFYITFSVAVS